MLLHDIVRIAASRHPDRVAVVAGDRTQTFTELRDDVWRLAGALGKIGDRGDRVAILAENLPAYVGAYYGVPAAGMALTFLNYRLHPEEWAWIVNDAGARVLMVQSRFLAGVWSVRDKLETVETVVVIQDGSPMPDGRGAYDVTFEELLASAPAEEPAVRGAPDELAWLLYTSGTTGFPKGAMLTHTNLLTAIVGLAIEGDRVEDACSLVAFPLCHVAGYTVPVAHLRGARIVLPEAFDPEGWMDLVDRHAVTDTAVAPTMLAMILDHPALDDHDLSSLRSLGYGAAAMPVEVLRRAIRRFGPIVRSGFGMTELAGNVLVFTSEAHERAVAGEEHLLASCGVPMSLAEVRVVDDEDRECPPGVVGEIVVRGDQVLSGYFGNETATAEAMRGGWFHTGDMARRDEEGFFYIVDRRKDMIITGGENVYSREVEEALYLHPGVAEAAVIGLPDERWGENVTAVVVLRSGVEATEADIIDTVRHRLAGYKKPKRVIFSDELPKNVSGKILKRQLRDRYAPT
ncbi:MAG: long-chain-fatty-acid--CoA ligase [Actinomycetota bacterium]|nr:long-chain-fatty-acid--CoA ligase [Actinomycetota bacterium]